MWEITVLKTDNNIYKVFLLILFLRTSNFVCNASNVVRSSHYGLRSDPSFMQLIVQEKECQFQFHNKTFGVISSPLYPLNYPNNVSCEWRIQMNKGSRIVVTIRQFFLAQGDELIVNDNRTVQVYTLQNPPNNVLFLSNENATITLKSALLIKNDKIGHSRSFYAMFESEGCGGMLTTASGYINVPVYIHAANRPHECVWSIVSPKNNVITLDFLEFDLQPGSCVYNNLYVRDGDKTGGYFVGDFCEENPPFSQLRTTTNIMTISYRTRPNLYGNKVEIIPSIKMFYKMVDTCGGELEGYSGTFATPTRWIDGVHVCNWTITVPQGKQILLKLRNWSVTKKENIIHESLQVISLTNHKSIIWDYLDNDQNPPESFLVEHNHVLVSWMSNNNRSAKPNIYFKGFYEAIKPATDDCLKVGNQLLYMCEDRDYIECSKRCDGVIDCTAGGDERNCPVTSFDALNKERFERLNKKRSTWSDYAILMMSAAGILVIVMILLILVDRFLHKNGISYRKSSLNRLDTLQPPPYKAVDDTLYSISSLRHPPPPYYFETTSDGSSEMMNRTTTYTPTALFHDTDIIESTVSQSYSPTPFRFTDSDEPDDTEAFLKEIQFVKEEEYDH